MARGNQNSRRRFLQLAGVSAVAALAGCGGDGGEATTPAGETTAAGDGLGPVPSEYETAESQDGTARNPDALSTKDAVEYQSEPSDGEQCSGCAFYIPDMNDDGLGACAIVEGMIEPSGWCVSYAAYEE